MILYKELTICKNTDYDRNTLCDFSKDEQLSTNTEIVYIYSIKNKIINYPLQDGKILYIGEACRKTEFTGKRFSQHISTKHDKGGDNGSNYTLSMYYWNNHEIILQIYFTKENENRKDIETHLLQVHMKKYGSLPIAQGSTGKNYTVDTIKKVTEEYQELL